MRHEFAVGPNVRSTVLQVTLQLAAVATSDDRLRHRRKLGPVNFHPSWGGSVGHRGAEGVIDAVAKAVRAGTIAWLRPVTPFLNRVFVAWTAALSRAAAAAFRLVAFGSG